MNPILEVGEGEKWIEQYSRTLEHNINWIVEGCSCKAKIGRMGVSSSNLLDLDWASKYKYSRTARSVVCSNLS